MFYFVTVYYYHEVLQLFKTECCDMVLIQSERIDRGDRYVLAMQSSDREGVVCPEGTTRVKVVYRSCCGILLGLTFIPFKHMLDNLERRL